MPVYTFRCLKCAKELEVDLGMAVEKILPELCECGGEFRRVFQPLNVIYRPGGFYTTDRRLDDDRDD